MAPLPALSTAIFTLLQLSTIVSAQTSPNTNPTNRGTILTDCLTLETEFTGTDGSKYRICKNSDFDVGTAQAIQEPSAEACASRCAATTGCSKAVYEPSAQQCHTKGNPAAYSWITDDRYVSIRRVEPVNTQRARVTECPTQETEFVGADGSVYRVCQNTDFECPSLQSFAAASDQACAQLCDRTSGCVKSVYEAGSNLCHLKGSPQSWNWLFDARYTTIRKVAAGGIVPIRPSSAAAASVRSSSATVLSRTVLSSSRASSTKPASSTRPASSSKPASSESASRIASSSASPSASRVPITPVGNYTGKWSGLINLPLIPAAGFIVPEQPESNRMLLFSAYRTHEFGGSGQTQFADYNFKTGAISQKTIANTQHDMFCPGISNLQDGKVLVTGGSDAAVASLYNPKTNSWTRAPDMKIARGYQTSATLSNGKVFTIGGSFSGGIFNKPGETYDPSTNAWTLLSGADDKPLLTADRGGLWRSDNHAWLYPWSDGSVFQAGPSKAQNWYGTNGAGSVTPSGIRDDLGDAMCAPNVMYDTGKILSAAGAADYNGGDVSAITRAHITTITTAFQPASVERVADMKYPRAFANAVVLPDGKTLVTGGQRVARNFWDTESILAPELFDPVTKTWRELAPAVVPRNYHSISLLMADGRVLAAGGGLCWTNGNDNDCDPKGDHPDGELFSPPYLFNNDGTLATRPVISALSSTASTNGYVVRVGGSLKVTMNDDSGATFSVIRLGSVTHSINSDQRRISLPNVIKNGKEYDIKLPSDTGILIPGYWFLFAVNSRGVPSIAKTVQITI